MDVAHYALNRARCGRLGEKLAIRNPVQVYVSPPCPTRTDHCQRQRLLFP
jgi:hypothetical protein